MAYKKKRTFFYAGSQRLPSAGDGDGGNANGSAGGQPGGSGNGRYNRFNRFNKNNGNGEEDESQITTGPAITIQLDKRKKITVRSYKGVKLVDIREFFTKRNDDGMQQELPGKKGISLTEDAWNKLVSQINSVQDALKKLDDPSSVGPPAPAVATPVEEPSRKKQKGEDGNAIVKDENGKKTKKSAETIENEDSEEESEEEVTLSNHAMVSVKNKIHKSEDDSDSDGSSSEEETPVSKTNVSKKDIEEEETAAELEAAMLEDSDEGNEDSDADSDEDSDDDEDNTKKSANSNTRAQLSASGDDESESEEE